MPILSSYGAKPSPFDDRDYKYSRLGTPVSLPRSGKVPRSSGVILNQGDEGSCVINTICECVEFLIPGFWASRSFGYRETRLLQHDLHSDDGCDPRTALKAFQKHGCPPESEWPYDGLEPGKSEWFAKTPSHKAYADGHHLKLGSYEALGLRGGLLNDIRDCLGNKKLPTMLSIAIYSSFESDEVARTGKVPMPDSRTDSLLGYHEISGWEYDDSVRLIKCLNHWDSDWGDGGWFYLPYDYVSNIKLLTDANIITGASLAIPKVAA